MGPEPEECRTGGSVAGRQELARGCFSLCGKPSTGEADERVPALSLAQKELQMNDINGKRKKE